MKIASILMIVSLATIVETGWAQRPAVDPADPALAPILFARGTGAFAAPAEKRASPAELAIASAEARIKAEPKSAKAHRDLAMALSRRGRETADPEHYEAALGALGQAMQLAPDELDNLKVETWILLGQHEFQAALAKAKTLQTKVPDDVMVYGLVVDACVELGRYVEAEAAAQWMLDLRPGNVPGLTRGAYLRELFGDVEGAIEFMRLAFEQTPPREFEDQAWLLTQIGHLHASVGRTEIAQKILESALQIFPDYHYALAHLAEVHAMQGDFERSLQLYERRYEVSSHPENLYQVALAKDRLQRSEDAERDYAAFEAAAKAESSGVDNANRELIAYYVDAGRPAEALALAEREIARRQDVHTRFAHARALLANGRAMEARDQLQAALAIGIQDARFHALAGEIALALEDRVAARAALERSLAIHPKSEVAARVRRLLQELK